MIGWLSALLRDRKARLRHEWVNPVRTVAGWTLYRCADPSCDEVELG